VLVLKGEIVGIEVVQSDSADSPRLIITAAGNLAVSELKDSSSAAIERILGTKIDLSEFYQFAEQDRDLRSLVLQFRGLKPPRFPSMFEALLNSISCQQISLNICVRLLNRLVSAWGPVSSLNGQPAYAFPESYHLIKVNPEDLRRLGYSYNKARSILEIVSQVTEGNLNLEDIARLDDSLAITTLMKLRGVGRWTSEYTLLRGAGHTYIFPTGDSGALGNLQRLLGKDRIFSQQEVNKILSGWSPYGGLIYFHLLLHKLTGLDYLK